MVSRQSNMKKIKKLSNYYAIGSQSASLGIAKSDSGSVLMKVFVTKSKCKHSSSICSLCGT